MKKLVYIFMIAAVLVSCKKNTTDAPAPAPEQQMQEVTFDINTILESPDRAYSVPNCIDSIDGEINKYAEIIIEDAGGILHTYFAEIYFVNGLPYTKAIMLPIYDLTDSCDSYVLKEFYVWDNMGTDLNYDGVPGDLGDPGVTARSDDQLFKAAPLTGSVFWDFAINHVEFQFEVCAFFKTKIKIDVICFVPDYYDLFGFFWFEITEITVREICFFGDFCLKDPFLYDGTIYESGGGLFIDEAAVFEIRARHQVGNGPLEDMVGSPFNNVDWAGIGEPLCVRYPDYDAEVDYYEFDLYLWAMVGNQMGWVYLYTFTWYDIFTDTYPTGPNTDEELNDGVFEFVVGNCVATPTDLLLPPYMNIPPTARVVLQSGGPVTGAYFDVKFLEIGSGWDIHEGLPWYAGWCGDHENQLVSSDYYAELYTTLDPVASMPASHLTDRNLEALNYLINHYDTHGIATPEGGPYGPQANTDIQESLWYVIHYDFGTSSPGYMPGSSLAVTMGSTALGSASVGYSPLPGGYAGILAFDTDGRSVYISQLILVLIDP
ncbi:MAG: hypothetical protein V2I62_09575 [Bacteroidales bacterium]|nr:hypothetical protein [Bacteroidales bacterium]